MLIRSMVARIVYGALRVGITLPSLEVVQAFSERARLRDLLKRLEINVVMDVGANRGLYSKRLGMMGFNGHIFSFEPVPEEFVRLSKLAKSSERWIPVNIALGSENGTKPFNFIKRAVDNWSDSAVFSSFLSFKDETQVDRIDLVKVKRLDSIIDDLLEPIDNPRVFLKVDTQGYDVEVIRGAEGCIDMIFGLQSEISVTPLYDGMPHYLQALSYYESLGFSLMDLFIVGRTKHGSILEYDCLMARLNELKHL